MDETEEMVGGWRNWVQGSRMQAVYYRYAIYVCRLYDYIHVYLYVCVCLKIVYVYE